MHFWNRLLLGFPREIKDIDCAFKLLHKDVITKTKPLLSEGAMVSTELLLKAYQADISFKQIGVTHYMRHIGQPTGSNFGVIIHAVQDTFALRLTLAIPDFAFSLKSSYTK